MRILALCSLITMFFACTDFHTAYADHGIPQVPPTHADSIVTGTDTLGPWLLGSSLDRKIELKLQLPESLVIDSLRYEIYSLDQQEPLMDSILETTDRSLVITWNGSAPGYKVLIHHVSVREDALPISVVQELHTKRTILARAAHLVPPMDSLLFGFRVEAGDSIVGRFLAIATLGARISNTQGTIWDSNTSNAVRSKISTTDSLIYVVTNTTSQNLFVTDTLQILNRIIP